MMNCPPLPLPREGWFVVGPMTRGYALLAPVCNLSPLFPVALPMMKEPFGQLLVIGCFALRAVVG